ncbi:hypothetical protein [Flavobacterium sp. PL002]|uniref:hypothetical protein n=1 Tax=Flavobacterium sp. PL002 TaxID=1897058 RepID=UPI0017878712|nr:hypothetical protein [Flavobacterium sp. PL002]MBE0392540.1 hypothetical protein [Flavobacterium sp. PL002]
MAKEHFNWKGLFVNEESEKTSKEETINPTNSTNTEINKFPESPNSFQPTESATTNPFLKEIFDVYEKGFESLNQSGFDFFEMYKSVISVGATNPQSYQMAFTMGKTINPELSKSFLLEKSKYYTDEIEKVYSKYDATGTSRKNDLGNAIIAEKGNLTKTISDLESKIAELQNELIKNKAELEKIDYKNKEQFSEIQLKIEANNLAKKKILDSINIVITGINQYL